MQPLSLAGPGCQAATRRGNVKHPRSEERILVRMGRVRRKKVVFALTSLSQFLSAALWPFAQPCWWEWRGVDEDEDEKENNKTGGKTRTK